MKIWDSVLKHYGAWKGQSGAGFVTLLTKIAGERLSGSASESYLAVRQEADCTVIGVQTAVAVGGSLVANDTHLLGILIHTALTGTCVVTGFADTAGASQAWTIPAGFVGGFDFKGALNTAAQLTITASNVADDNKIVVLTRPAV